MDRSSSHDKGQRVVPAGRVRDSGLRVKLAIPGQETVEEPILEVVRDGDIVRALDIICSCGQRIRVLCDYEGTADG
jgi:hypothetical protein